MNVTSPICCASTENYQSFAAAVWIYGSPILCILGTVANILVVIVMQRKEQRKYTTSLYLSYLALLDTLIQYTGLSRQWILAQFGFDIRNKSSGICKLHLFLMYYLVQVEAWLLSSIAIERVAAVWWPIQARFLFTRRFAAIQIASFSVFLFVVNAHIFWTQELIHTEIGNICAIKPNFRVFRGIIWGWMDMILATIVPFSVMICSNIAVVVKIAQQHQKRKRGSSQEAKVQSVTVMLLTVCVVFLLCTLPLTIYLSDTESFDVTYGCCFSTYVIWPTLNIFFYFNNTSNFFLYFVSGRKFREQLRAMFVCRSNLIVPHQ